MIPKRTLFFTTFVIPQIIYILSQNSIIKHYAEAVQESSMMMIQQQQQHQAISGNDGMLTVVGNVTFLPKFANQNTVARKFDVTDWNLISESNRFFIDGIIENAKNAIYKVILKIKTAFGIVKWWEPELDFGNCIVESVFNINPKAKFRSFGLRIVKVAFNYARNWLSSFVTRMSMKQKEPSPEFYIDYYPSQILYTAPAEVVAEQAAYQHRPSIFYKRRRQGRSHQNLLNSAKEKFLNLINDSSYGYGFNKNSINNSDGKNLQRTLSSTKTHNDYVHSSEHHLNKQNIIDNLGESNINTIRRPQRHNIHDNINKRNEMVDSSKNKNNDGDSVINLSVGKQFMNINESVFVTWQNGKRIKRNLQQFAAYTNNGDGSDTFGGVDPAQINALESQETPVNAQRRTDFPSHTTFTYPSHTTFTYANAKPQHLPSQYKIVHAKKIYPKNYAQRRKQPVYQQRPVYVQFQNVQQQQQQQPPPQYTYQKFIPHQGTDNYQGSLTDAEEYLNARPITVDLQETYSNWVTDYEGLILSRFGLEEKQKKPSGFIYCAQEYTLTLVVRFFETLLGKLILGKKK